MKNWPVICVLALVSQTAGAITTEIPAGTVVNGGDVHTIVTQKVYGEANNFTVSGIQQVMNGGKTSGSVIYPYGQQDVMNGGVSYNTAVQYYAVQNIDGTSYSSTVDSYGTVDVNAGGYAEGTTVNGGSFFVSSGANSAQTILNSGHEYISGIDRNTVVNGGIQEIRSGGTAADTALKGGTQQVNEGGKSENTTISGSGHEIVYGTAVGTVVENDGSLSVYGTGYAENTVVSGGFMEVNGNASSKATTITAGTQEVYGVDSNSIIKGGTQSVYGGGKAENAVVQDRGVQYISYNGKGINSQVGNGGLQEIGWGGSSEQSTISAGGEQKVSGTAVSTRLDSGGAMEVETDGKAESTVISGGQMTVAAGGLSAKTTLNSGTQIVSGTDAGSTVNGGVQQIVLGGNVSDAVVNGGVQEVYGTAVNTLLSGGRQDVKSGGIAQKSRIEGGIQNIFQGGIAEDSEIASGMTVLYSGGKLNGHTEITKGVLTVYGNNDISNLTLNDSLVNMPHGNGYTNLQIDELNGTGVFNLSSNLAENVSDHLNIKSGSGNFGLIIHDYSTEGSLPPQIKIIDENSAAADNFYLVGNAVDVGAFQYDLRQEGNDWVLSRTPELTDSSLIAKNTYNSLSSLFYTHLSPVYGRLKVFHRPNGHDNGLWIKGIGRQIKFDYKDATKSDMDIYGTSLGLDRQMSIGSGNSLKLGVYGGYTNSRQKYDRAGHADGSTESLGLYATMMTPRQWFWDVVGSYYWHTQKIRSYTPSGSPVDGKYKNNSWQLSTFFGRRFDFDGQWFLEPVVGLRYMRIEGISYRTNFNTLVSADDADFLSGSLGLSGGKSFAVSEKTLLDVYGRFNLIHDWDGKNVVQVADYRFSEDASSLRYELGAGMNFSLNEGASEAYFDIATQLGSKIRYPWEINVGLMFNF